MESEELVEARRGGSQGRVCGMCQDRAGIFPGVLGKMGGEIAPKLNLGVGGEMMKEPKFHKPQGSGTAAPVLAPGEGEMDECPGSWHMPPRHRGDIGTAV